jgi:hypothetical protein
MDLGSHAIPAPLAVSTHATAAAMFIAIISLSLGEYALVASRDPRGEGAWQPLESARGTAIAWQKEAATVATGGKSGRRGAGEEATFAVLVTQGSAVPAAPQGKKRVREYSTESVCIVLVVDASVWRSSRMAP